MMPIKVIGIKLGTHVPGSGFRQQGQLVQVLNMPDISRTEFQAIKESPVIRNMLVCLLYDNRQTFFLICAQLFGRIPLCAFQGASQPGNADRIEEILYAKIYSHICGTKMSVTYLLIRHTVLEGKAFLTA